MRLGELEDQFEGDPDFHELVFSEFLPEVILNFEGYPVGQVAKELGVPITRLFREMYLADVVHILLCLRIKSYGNELRLGGPCICDRRIQLGTPDDPPHELDSLQVRVYEGDEPPMFTVELSDRTFTMSPPRLNQLKDLRNPEFADQRLNLLLLTEDGDLNYDTISDLDDMAILNNCADLIKGGAYDEIEMNCPMCDREWSHSLELGVNYEDFFFSLMSAPRQLKQKGKDGQPDTYCSTEESLDEQSHILLFGEQAPLKSLSEFFGLTPQQRTRHINKVIEAYKHQAEETKKASSQSRRRK